MLVKGGGGPRSGRIVIRARTQKFPLKTAKAELVAGSTKTLKLRPKGSKKKSAGTLAKIESLVKRGAKAKAKIEVTATDSAGESSSSNVTVNLKG